MNEKFNKTLKRPGTGGPSPDGNDIKQCVTKCCPGTGGGDGGG